MTGDTGELDLAALASEVETWLGPLLGQAGITDVEIDAATARHPDQGDDLYHASRLLYPTHPLMKTSAVYAGHCRELLERVAAGTDTRPGTDAEICCVASEASQVAPMNTTGAGVYARAFASVFPAESAEIWGDLTPHYEALRGSEIDSETATLRRKMAQANPGRTMKGQTVECSGRHNGIEVNCRYAKPEEPS